MECTRIHTKQMDFSPEPVVLFRKSLLVLVGPSGSGKSTFAKNHFPLTMIASTDHCRAMICDFQGNQRISDDAFDLFYMHIEKRLKNGYPVVADSTALRKKYRQKFWAMADKYEYEKVLFLFDLPLSLCQENDASRRFKVGKDVVAYQFGNLERTKQELHEEPYDKVFVFKSLEEMQTFSYRWLSVKERAQQSLTNSTEHDARTNFKDFFMEKHKTIIEPFKIKMVEPLRSFTREEREQAAKKAGYNLFLVPAEYITFDFLTDSGTTAMSAAQWGAMMVADEVYAGSKSFAKFEKTVQNLTGCPYVIPTHQGRAAEHLLFSLLVKPGMMVPSNNHFDTTRANIEQLGGIACDFVTTEGKDTQAQHPFKGNVDLEKMEAFCRENQKNIPLGMITITNNTGGGQPVSLENIRALSQIYHRYNIPFILDACRFAENSYFIKLREPGMQNRDVRSIVHEIFSLADGCMMSGKKDGLVNIGGFIALRDGKWVNDLRNNLILTEGFPTYGGLAARDLEAFAVGLEEVLQEEYLSYRLAVVRYMAEGLNKLGIPTVQPAGGHAVYIDAKRFLPHIPSEQFPGQALVVELYLSEGIRSCEIGSVMFSKTDKETGKFLPASMELVRMAFPRRVYTQSHFDYILEGMQEIAKNKNSLRGMKFSYTPPFLKHFTARFEYV